MLYNIPYKSYNCLHYHLRTHFLIAPHTNCKMLLLLLAFDILLDYFHLSFYINLYSIVSSFLVYKQKVLSTQSTSQLSYLYYNTGICAGTRISRNNFKTPHIINQEQNQLLLCPSMIWLGKENWVWKVTNPGKVQLGLYNNLIDVSVEELL